MSKIPDDFFYNKETGKLKTIGENVDDLILAVAKVTNSSLDEAVSFIEWKCKKFLESNK